MLYCGVIIQIQELDLYLIKYKYKEKTMLVDIKDLHPTQIAVGYQQVYEKERKIKKLDKSDRKTFLKDRPVPVVIGPCRKMYLVDHHHLCRAAYNLDIESVYVNVIDNCEDMSDEDFWDHMANKEYIWLHNNDGRVLTLDEFLKLLPRHIKDLKDDPYRSIAGVVRKQGGYQKVTKPFTEFVWADYFRQRIDLPAISRDFPQDVINTALKLAKLPETSHLPGSLSL